MKFEKIYLKIIKEYDFLFNVMNKKLSKKRIKHTLGVAKIAYFLANKYKKNIYKCILASFFHDFFRELENNEIIKLSNKYLEKINYYEKKNPIILHGKLAAEYFFREKLIIMPEVLNAIKNHTTANIEMDDISKIIFISDAIEENRKYKEIKKIRKYVLSNSLNNSFFYILKNVIKTLLLKNSIISNTTIDAYNEQIKKQYKKKC